MPRPQGAACDIGAYEVGAACALRPSEMVAWWPLDGLNSEGKYDDLAGGDNNGRPIGNPSQIPNQYVGNSLQAGTGKYVEVSDVPNLNFGQTSFTIDAWVKYTPATQTEPIVFKLANQGGYSLYLSTSTSNGPVDRLHLQIGSQIYQGPQFSVPVGTWVFVAARINKTYFDTGTIDLYVGVPGSPLKIASLPAGDFNASSHGTPLQIGHWSFNPHASLGIDEVEIFSRALSEQAEIQSIFEAGSVGKCKPTCLNPPPSGMVAWWPLDEAQGSQVVHDLAGAHDGTPMDFGGAVTTIGATGGPKPVTGLYVDNSLLFEGSHVEVPDSEDLNFGVDGKEPFTIDAWVNYYPLHQSRPIVSKRGSFNGPGYFLSIEPAGLGVFKLTLQIAGVKYIGPEVPASTWVFVAATRDANGVKLYVGHNNTLTYIQHPASPVNARSEGTPLWIGQQQGPGNVHPTAQIDEVEIFNRALDEPEIATIFKADWAGKCKQQCVPPPSGMVSWWPGDGNANDIQDGNNGTLTNGATFVPGRVGQAFSFDGVDDYVELGQPANLMPSNTDFTVVGWILVPDYPNNSPESRCGSNYPIIGSDWGWSIRVSNEGRVAFGKYTALKTGVSVESTSVISTNTFHHFAAVHTVSELRIYVDGALAGTQASPTGTIFYYGGPDTLQIGQVHCGIGKWNGKGLIDELAFFNRALTACEIKAIVDNGSTTGGMGTVIIRKNTVGGDNTFGYTTGAGLNDFTIPTSGGTGSQTFNNIAAGPTTVTESSSPPGWVFTSLACSDPDNGTTISGQTANIDLDAGETVTCTYTNTKCPLITLNPASGPLPASGINAPYIRAFTASGGCASSFIYSVTAGTLPPGLALASNGGLSGAATQLGDFTFTVTATDSCGCSRSETYTLNAQKSAPNDVKAKRLVISAFRENGPNGAGDEFIEIFNPSAAAVTIGTLPGVSIDGIGVFSNAGNNAGVANNAVFLRCQIPGTAVIKGRGWYLCGGADYSLSNLGLNGGTTHSVPDTTIGTGNAVVGDIPDDAGLVLLNVGTNTVTLSSAGFFSGGSPAVVFDSVGFRPYGLGAPATGAQPSLAFKYCEGTCLHPVGDASIFTLTPGVPGCPMAVGPDSDPSAFPVLGGGTVGGISVCYGESGQYQIGRRRSAQQFQTSVGNLHRDTDDNADDFILDAPNPGTGNVGLSITGVSGVSSVLGVAGPHSSSAPPIIGAVIHAQDGFDTCAGAVIPCIPGALTPRNAERRYHMGIAILNGQNAPLGTFILRRRFTNALGSTTGVRYRIDDISTLCGGQIGVNGIGSAVATQEARNLRGPDFLGQMATSPVPTCQGEGSDTGVFTAILKAVSHGQETVVDSANIARTVFGSVLEDNSAGAAGLPAVGRHQPFGGGSNSSFVATTATEPTGDGVNGGTGSFAIITGPQGSTFRIAFKFGVVRSGRFKLLIGPEVNSSQPPAP